MTLTNDKSQNKANNKIHKLGYMKKTNKQTKKPFNGFFVHYQTLCHHRAI